MKNKLMKSQENIISENYKLILLCFIFLTFSFLIGFFLPLNFQNKWTAFVKEYISSIQFGILPIFLNNFLISLLIITGGLVFCIPSILLSGINFFSLGVLVGFFLSERKFEVFLLSLIPHGIVELPAIFLSFFFSLKIFNLFYIKKHRFDEFFFLIFKKYILISIILFLIASIIEVYITPFIIFSIYGKNFTF